MDMQIHLSSKDIYVWIEEMAKKSDKTVDQLVEDAIWYYKNELENLPDVKKMTIR